VKKEIITKINNFWRNPQTKKYFWGDWLDVRYYLCDRLSEFKNKKILDISCQTGVVIKCLDRSNQIYGIDIDADSINICKQENPNANLIIGDIFSQNFDKESFDIIILAHVLPSHDYQSQHKPEELIQLCLKWLKPDGYLFVTTPNGENPYFKKKNKITIENLKKIFSGFNYKILEWNPFPIQAQKILRYTPQIFEFLKYDMQNKKDVKKSISFYVVATKTS